MGRVRRVDVGGMVYHALNRANFGSRLFKKEAHYQDFLGLMGESLERAEEWPWSSVYAWLYGNESQKGLLSPWPVPEPGEYLEWLNRSQPKEEVEKIRHAIKRSKPYGSEGWASKAVAQFGLENTVRNPWRPGKGT